MKSVSVLALIPVASSCLAQAPSYSWTTIAGSPGALGYADGTNASARFNRPSGLARAADGTLYVTEQTTHTVRSITPVGRDWIVTTVAGLSGVLGSSDGTNTDARFDRPSSIALDAAGNLLITDNYNHTIRKITPVGTNWVVTTVAGTPGFAGYDDGRDGGILFKGPQSIAIDDSANLYVTDRLNFTIRKLEPAGTNLLSSTIAGMASIYGGFVDGLNAVAEFNLPWGIAVNSDRVLFVTDFGNNAIRRIAQTGPNWRTTTIAGFSGNIGTTDGPGSLAMFNAPNGITLDTTGTLYITDQYNNTVRTLTPAGGDWVIHTIGGTASQAGTTDGIGSAARFYRPWGIAIDDRGNLYVADNFNHTIRMGIRMSQPTLQILASADHIVLSWPAVFSNFILETSSSVGSEAVWTPHTNGIILAAQTFMQTNSPTQSAAFFRLREGPGE